MSTTRDFIDTWFHRVWTEQDTSAIDEMLVPDGTAEGLGENHREGPEGFKKFHSDVCAMFVDIVITVDKILERDKWVSTLCTFRSKRRDTGEPVETTGSMWFRISDGKITEVYNHWDYVGLFESMKLLPQHTLERGLRGEKIA